ncbi:SLATT domain-containing protein [Amycolatopsis sp. NPDC024027]|uniref:SLATT domain-containing protein n=1 Tax=Amycolatopsis sp. NPDC024027 TaxID=3154327 RepID=UPI0033E5C139
MTDAESNNTKRRALEKELKTIQAQAHNIAGMQFAQALLWRFINLAVGLPAAASAAVAGGLALSGSASSGVVGVLSLVSASLASLQAILGAQKRQFTAEHSGNAYLEVRNSARRLERIDLESLTHHEARARLEAITLRQEEINRSSDPPSVLAIWRGKRFSAKKRIVAPHIFDDPDQSMKP